MCILRITTLATVTNVCLPRLATLVYLQNTDRSVMAAVYSL